jgi:hypothetical protein
MKYLVCFPGGGLGNMLWNINMAINYAKKYDRKLIIDSTKKGWFKMNIFDFINITEPTILNEPVHFVNESLKVYDPKVNMPLNKNYDDEIIYNYSAMQPQNFKVFNYITIKKVILDTFNKRLKLLPRSYIGLHIRNTDKKSDYRLFIEKHAAELENNSIFLATDNIDVITYIKGLYGINVFSFSNIPDNTGKKNGIHYNHIGICQRDFIIDCFVDMLLLASSSSYYFSCVNSSYSKMAKYLFDNKQILNKILILNKPMFKNIHLSSTISTSNINEQSSKII